ncbi:MAG: Flp pilus assembly complex ATPase component TadA [Armatimonadetes bacterium]|nr:Flp pilus assembly complex ATPase component TadA [Armatimonadota bacterium]
MSNVRRRLGDHLIALKLINQDQLSTALELQKDSPAPLGSILVSLGFLTEDLLLKALAAQMGVSPWTLGDNPPTPEAVSKVPGHLCRTYQVLPVAVRHDLLVLAMRNPADLDAIDLIRNFSGMRIEPVLVDADRLMKTIDETYRDQPGAAGNMDTLVASAIKEFNIDLNVNAKREKLTGEVDERPVVGLINQVLADAIRLGASDVHIEPRPDKVEVRYRVDGQLVPVRDFPIALHPMFSTRLKIMAELDIVEHRIPQDGRISAMVDNRLIDLRVSILPNQHGSRIVLRILDKSASIKSLDQLGFSQEQYDAFKSKVEKPYGLYLVTGPTGSGKTTTLYAALNQLRTTANNIMTCEDPIEYEMPGINQSQVNEKVGLTFALQLRAILRQDPDIILVGEIRDGETANIAIRAALTGHLVLSTLHCNDAPSAVPRLLDMGLDPFLLSTCLLGVSSQRLIRNLCTSCREPAAASDEDMKFLREYLNDNEIPMLYKSVGCAKCGYTGFKGRQAVHEVMPLSAPIANAIAERATLNEVREVAEQYGYKPMRDAAINLVLNGVTTLQEARRQVFFETTEELLTQQQQDFRKAS